MRLKQLRLKGFKSFANDTVIHFNEDVIGVVGPNGSGKSNIVDAIRWVLGEQKTKELRLEQMADVIFNGTKTRKEAPSAVVELIFENDKGILPTEYQTVSVSRTVYRSGESEYRLNDVVCRLKDIKTLLMDTGIGSNSYAIISLGMVDDLLYDKDDSRRYMFEQAAGVSKYKSRKKETLSKLNSTNQDLDRVQDLLFEIEGNMKTLEKQAKRTKKYFDIKEEYKTLAVQNAVLSIQSLKDRYKQIGEEINNKQDAFSKINIEVIAKEAELENFKKNNLEQELSVSQKQKELNEIIASVRNLENDKNLLLQKINFKSQSLTNIEQLIKDNQAQVEIINRDIENLETKLNEELNKEIELKEILDVAESRLNEAKEIQGNAKSEFEQRTRAIQELQKQIFDIDKDLAITSNNIESQKSEIERSKEEAQIHEEEKHLLEIELKELTTSLELKLDELNALKIKEESRKANIVEFEIQKEKLTEELGKLNRTIDARQNEYDLLKSMIENFEGFPESMKYLSSNWKKDVPVLSDLLDVNEEYKSVIEHYLEPYLSYFVVNDIAEAAEAIRLLGGAQKGKANFFLLNKIPNNQEQFQNIPLARPARECVSIDAKYAKLLDYLLQKTYVFDGNLEDFKYDTDYNDYNFLSKNASFYKTRFSISGGSVGLFEGKKIGRKKNLEKLEALITESNNAKNKINENLEKIKTELLALKSSDKTLELELLTKEINKLEQERTRQHVGLENLTSKINERETKVQKSTALIEQYTESLKNFEIKKVELKRQLDKEEGSIKNNNIDLDGLTSQLNMASEVYNNANIEYIKHQNSISNLQKDFDFKKTRSNELKQRIENEINQKNADTEELSQLENQKISIEEKLIEIYKLKEEFQTNLNDSEQRYYAARNTISGLEEEIRVLNRGLAQHQSDINTLKDTYQEMKFQINAIGDRIYIEFNISLEEMMNIPLDENLIAEELNQKVEQLKSKIHNYGEINPMAMEAFDEIKQRYDLIITQKQDIELAKNSLLETIKEIETNATAQFMQAFEEIRANFINVFRSLFTEDDNCDLVLMEPDNPLESPIEIIAKPKGKKPKSLSQLSGGEKTLTATALLFALYLLKPAPFCVFDEVDAPLDDANIQKFNKIIQKFSEKSQFIIVTHNKATMTAVDTLYGVFMREMGVSGLTQVDFRNFKNDPIFEEIVAN